MLFIVQCFNNNLAVSSVLTYMSALSYYHKINKLDDHTCTFRIKKCLTGYQKLKNKCDTRKPITYAILDKLVLSLHHTSNTYYVCMMVRAMYLLAFYALLRVGEFTTSSNQNVIVQATDIKFNHNLFFKSPII